MKKKYFLQDSVPVSKRSDEKKPLKKDIVETSPEKKHFFSGDKNALKTKELLEIFSPERDKIAMDAQKQQKTPEHLPEKFKNLITPFLEKNTQKTQAQVFENLHDTKARKIVKHLQKGAQKPKKYINQVDYKQALADLREFAQNTYKDLVFHRLSIPTYITDYIPKRVLNTYRVQYQEHFEEVEKLYTYVDRYIHDVLVPHVLYMKDHNALKSASKQYIDSKDELKKVLIINSEFQDFVKDLLCDTVFPTRDRGFGVIPRYIVGKLLEELKKTGRNAISEGETVFIKNSISGMFGETYGKKMFEEITEKSGGKIRVSEIILDDGVRRKMNSYNSIDAIYKVETDDFGERYYGVDFKNNDSYNRIQFGDETIVELYRRKGFDKITTTHDASGKEIGHRGHYAKRMLIGMRGDLHLEKTDPVRLLAVKAGLHSFSHYTPEIMEQGAKDFYKTFVKSQFPEMSDEA